MHKFIQSLLNSIREQFLLPQTPFDDGPPHLYQTRASLCLLEDVSGGIRLTVEEAPFSPEVH